MLQRKQSISGDSVILRCIWQCLTNHKKLLPHFNGLNFLKFLKFDTTRFISAWMKLGLYSCTETLHPLMLTFISKRRVHGQMQDGHLSELTFKIKEWTISEQSFFCGDRRHSIMRVHQEPAVAYVARATNAFQWIGSWLFSNLNVNWLQIGFSWPLICWTCERCSAARSCTEVLNAVVTYAERQRWGRIAL